MPSILVHTQAITGVSPIFAQSLNILPCPQKIRIFKSDRRTVTLEIDTSKYRECCLTKTATGLASGSNQNYEQVNPQK